jgi:hypothetical protein
MLGPEVRVHLSRACGSASDSPCGDICGLDGSPPRQSPGSPNGVRTRVTTLRVSSQLISLPAAMPESGS